MVIIAGLTGKYCAGKNTIAALFEQNGFIHIDVDKLGHAALPKIQDQLISHFGEEILEDGIINRKKLGSIVFSDPDEKKFLESIIHPCMVDMVREKIAEADGSDILINAAILHQMGLDSLCNSVIWVDAPLLTRIKRALKRDNIPLKEVLKRIRTQSNLNTNLMLKNSDTYTIRNSGSSDRISVSVEKLIEKLKEGNI